MYQNDDTRVWWDGSEVNFLRWTESALIFSWYSATETAVQMPRGTVVRLLQKGVLYVEGFVPEWVNSGLGLPETQPIAAQKPAPPAPAQAKAEKVSMLTRLIRKLGGNTERAGIPN
jgi:hypothetical protein